MRSRTRMVWWLLLSLCLVPAVADAQSTEPFPRPAAIEPAVRFWTRVYTEVDTNAGFMHDSRNLGVVYEMVRFPSKSSRGARDRIKRKSRDRIKRVLRTLAGGKRSGLSKEEARILALFPPGVSNGTLRSASKQVRFQLGQANKFEAGLVRMGRWEAYIKNVLAERGLPEGLVAIPHVESSYNPEAISGQRRRPHLGVGLARGRRPDLPLHLAQLVVGVGSRRTATPTMPSMGPRCRRSPPASRAGASPLASRGRGFRRPSHAAPSSLGRPSGMAKSPPEGPFALGPGVIAPHQVRSKGSVRGSQANNHHGPGSPRGCTARGRDTRDT